MKINSIFLRIFLFIFSGNFPNLSRGWYRFLDRSPSSKILNKKIENYGKKLHFSPKIFGTEIDFSVFFPKILKNRIKWCLLWFSQWWWKPSSTLPFDTHNECVWLLLISLFLLFFISQILNDFPRQNFGSGKNRIKEKKENKLIDAFSCCLWW